MKVSLIALGLCIAIVGVAVLLVRMDLLPADYLGFLPSLIAIVVACVALYVGMRAVLSRRREDKR
jgi:putative flippase GtrA